MADRVCLGLLPSSEGSWLTAVRALRCIALVLLLLFHLMSPCLISNSLLVSSLKSEFNDKLEEKELQGYSLKLFL